MKKLNLKEVPKLKKNPIFKGLPERLKDPSVYEKIERELFEAMKTDHKHKTVKQFVTCAWCQKKRELKQNKMKAMGFKSMGQYLEWRRIMQIITSKANFQLS